MSPGSHTLAAAHDGDVDFARAFAVWSARRKSRGIHGQRKTAQAIRIPDRAVDYNPGEFFGRGIPEHEFAHKGTPRFPTRHDEHRSPSSAMLRALWIIRLSPGRAFTVKATPDMVPTGSESRRTSGVMAHIRVHGIRDRSRCERSIGPDQFGSRQRTLGKNAKTNRHKNLGMAEAPLPVAAINGKGRTARGERAARPAGRGFRVWDSNFNVSFEASPQGYQEKGNQQGYPFHQFVLFFKKGSTELLSDLGTPGPFSEIVIQYLWQVHA